MPLTSRNTTRVIGEMLFLGQVEMEKTEVESFSGAAYSRSLPPKEFHIEPKDLEIAQLLALKQIVSANVGETAVDSFLQKQPALLAACMNFTQFGHHGTWVVPQQLVRPPSQPAIRGLKPDYIVGGKGSDGYSWYVVELKSPRAKLFNIEIKLAIFS